MKKIALLAFLLCSQLIVAQDALSGIYKENEVDTKPSFPGGLKAFTKFVNKNFNWTNNKNSKSVTIEFTVQTNGVFIINHVSSVGSGNEIEAVRVLRLSPKWKPATVKGKAVICTIVRTMYNPHANEKEKPTVEVATVPIPETTEPVTVIQDINQISPVYNASEVEQLPQYPGGIKQFYTAFYAAFTMPEQEVNGKEIVSFIIEKDGSLSDIKILRDVSSETGKETIRVLKNLRKWIPGERNIRPVRVLYTLPILIDNSAKPEPEKK